MQLSDIVTRALIRPGSYLGWLRELLVTGVCLVCYPFGIGGTTPEPRSDDLPTPPFALEADAAPVLLVHGYGHNRSGWTFLVRHLRQCGFERVYSFNYSPLARDLPGLAWELARHLVARVYSRFSRPRKTSLNWFIPALVNSSVGSLAGTSDEEWISRWPF